MGHPLWRINGVKIQRGWSRGIPLLAKDARNGAPPYLSKEWRDKAGAPPSKDSRRKGSASRGLSREDAYGTDQILSIVRRRRLQVRQGEVARAVSAVINADQ